MKHGEFIINEIHSKKLKSLIQFRPEIASPKRKVNRKGIAGVSEEYIFDEEAYENTPISLELFMRGETEREVRELKDKITLAFMGGRYLDFVPYWDSEMLYQVEVVEPPVYEQSGNHPLKVPYTVGLSVKPFKTEQNKIERETSSMLTLVNPYGYDNEPIITLYGTGNMDLLVNGKKYVFKDIDEHVVVDSQIESAYKLIAGKPNSRNNRMYTLDFPVLNPGENKISTSGNVTKIKVETRWKTLVS